MSSRVSRSLDNFLFFEGFLDNVTLDLRNLVRNDFNGGKTVSLDRLDIRLVEFIEQSFNRGSQSFIFGEELLEETVER